MNELETEAEEEDDEDIEVHDALRFKGEIIVVKRFNEVEGALSKLFMGEDAQKQGLGFDMEWQPEFIKGQVNPIALIQLATSNLSFLYLHVFSGSPTKRKI